MDGHQGSPTPALPPSQDAPEYPSPPSPWVPAASNGDSRWVWRAARWTAAIYIVGLGAIAAALVAAAAVDLRRATDADHVNDDGTGWVTVFAFIGLVCMLPLLIAAIVNVVLAVRRHRASLILNIIGGGLLFILGLTATSAHPAWGLLALGSAITLGLAIAGLTATSSPT